MSLPYLRRDPPYSPYFGRTTLETDAPLAVLQGIPTSAARAQSPAPSSQNAVAVIVIASIYTQILEIRRDYTTWVRGMWCPKWVPSLLFLLSSCLCSRPCSCSFAFGWGHVVTLPMAAQTHIRIIPNALGAAKLRPESQPGRVRIKVA